MTPGDRDALARFLRERDLCGGPLSVRRIGDGHSNARLMDALRDTAVPVPAVLATARAGEVFDVPCYVMTFAEGPVITAGTPAALARPGRGGRSASP